MSHCVTIIQGKDTVWSVLTSVPHWIGEFTCTVLEEIVLVLVARPFVKRYIRKHDKEFHDT